MSERKLGWTFDLKGVGSGVSKLSKLSEAWSKIQEKVKGANEEIKGAAQRSKIDMEAWSNAFKELGQHAGKAFQSMISNSPALGAAFARLGFATDILAMKLGEVLAPVIEPVIDKIIEFIDWVSAAPEEVQLFISIIIGLTFALALLVPAIIAVQIAGAPLIIIILATIIAIAAIIVVVIWMRKNWDNLTVAIQKVWKIIVVLIYIISLVFPVIALIIAIVILVKLAFENWGAIVKWFKDRFKTIMNRIRDVINWIGDIFKRRFGGMMDAAKDGWNAMVKWFVDKFLWFKDKIMEIYNKVKDPIKKIGDAARSGVDKVGDAGRSAADFVGFAEGGDVLRTGLAIVHGGEKVLNPSQTTAFKSLFGAEGRAFSAGSGGGSGGTIIVQNEINVPGGIFTDEDSLWRLADLVSEIVVEKVLEGSPV